MNATYRFLPLVIGAMLLTGFALVVGPGWRFVGVPLIGLAILGGVLIARRALAGELEDELVDAEEIEHIEPKRRAELIRGTSLHLRNLQYRYSIRVDRNQPQEQKSFTAIVNTIRLGFVPVVIMDNDTDRQGYGYVAFVHDGKRWRGPGLPCPAGRDAAIAHARRCVSPLDADRGDGASDGSAGESGETGGGGSGDSGR